MTDIRDRKAVPTAAQVLERQRRDHADKPEVGRDAARDSAFAPAAVPAAAPVASAVTVPSDGSEFQQYADAIAPRNIVGKLLKFSKGDYTAGDGGEQIAEGTRLVAVMDELWTGWTRWENNKPAESRIGRVVDKFAPPQRPELGNNDRDEWPVDDQGDPRDPWQFGNYLVLKDPETGEFFTFTTGTRGGITAIADLCRHYARDVKQHPGTYPVIALKADSYAHPNRAYGRVKIPVLTVVGRVVRDDTSSGGMQSAADDMDDQIPW